jgi:peptide/nickel transport system substrate-binding protein
MKRSTAWTLLVTIVMFAMLFTACAPAATPAPAAEPTKAPAAAEPTKAPAAAEPTKAPAAAEPTKAPEAAAPQTGGVVTFAMKEDVTSMDPLKAIQYGDIRLNILVAQQLVAPDRGGNFVGVLAEKWDTSADGKTWTFYLRQGVKFHNGQEMTSDDVKWIFDRILDEKAGAAMRTTFANIGTKVEAVDKYTVKFTIEKGQGPFLSYLTLLNRAAIIHKDSYDAEGKVTKIIGTGPFMMDESKPGESYTLKKFADYWKKGEPKLDGVVLKVITDPNVRLNALKTGEVTMAEELPMVEVEKLMKAQDPNFTTQVYYINSGERLVMNTTSGPFKDKNARLALEYIFDREQYNQAVFFGLGQVHNQPFTPDNIWHLDVPIIKPDLAKAQEYFKASGLPQGTKVKFLMMANQKDKGEFIQAMLSQIGFAVEFDVVDSAAWTDKGKKYEYDLLLGTMTGIFDPDRPYGYLTKNSGSNWLVGGYDSEQMNALLDQGRSETDVTKRKEIYTKALQLVQDDAATMYTIGLPWVEAWSNKLHDYTPGTSPALMMMDASDGLNTAWLEQ